MLAFYETNGIKELEISIIPTFYNTIPSDELDYFLYKANAQLLKKDVLMIIDYANQIRFQKNRREGTGFPL